MLKRFTFVRPHWLLRPLFALLAMGQVRIGADLYGNSTDGLLRIRMGWFYRVDIPVNTIVELEPVTKKLLVGVRGWRRTWWLNTTRENVTRIAVEPAAKGRFFGIPIKFQAGYLSLAEPQRFSHFVTGARQLEKPVPAAVAAAPATSAITA